MTRSPTPSTSRPTSRQEDLTYTITDALPEGTTYVRGLGHRRRDLRGRESSRGGVTSASTYGEEGNYDVTTSATDDPASNPRRGAADISTSQSHWASRAEHDAWVTTKRVHRRSRPERSGFYGEPTRGCRSPTTASWSTAADNYGGRDLVTPQAVPRRGQARTTSRRCCGRTWRSATTPRRAPGVTLAASDGDQLARCDRRVRRHAVYVRRRGRRRSATTCEVIADGGQQRPGVRLRQHRPGAARTRRRPIGTENADGTEAAALVNDGDASTSSPTTPAVCVTTSEPEAERRELQLPGEGRRRRRPTGR